MADGRVPVRIPRARCDRRIGGAWVVARPQDHCRKRVSRRSRAEREESRSYATFAPSQPARG